jgi:hypothetical protein
MDTVIKIKDIFSLIPNIWFWIIAGILNVAVRAILVIFKALAINNGEADDSKNEKEFKWEGQGFRKVFKHSFLSNGKDVRIDDYWLPSIIGYFELIIFPLLIAKDLIVVIGAWMAIKTASSWGGWEKTRTAYNRFLLGNLLSLSVAFAIYKIFKLYNK